jgi:hypothetical protein
MFLTEHLTLAELTNSKQAKKLGIDNNPNEQQLSSLILLAMKIFQPIRNHFKSPIIISSGFRSEKLNKAIGGAKNSQHMKGEAIDIDNDNTNISNRDIFFFIKDNLDFDQLIAEKPNNGNLSWVHVSYSFFKKNRKEVLVFKNNKYFPYKGETDLL